mgnify:CR=1 FL=1
MKTSNDGHNLMPAHIEDEDLVAYLDGESDLDSQRAAQVHLESCWYCRSRIANVERSIESFLQLRHDDLLPREIPPSGPSLELFTARLATHRAVTPAHSFYRRFSAEVSSWPTRLFAGLNVANYSLRSQVIATRAIAAVVGVSVLVGFVFLSGNQTVSAAELLKLSIEAQEGTLAKVDQPVLFQRIRVKANYKSDQAVVWDVWTDTVNSRVATKDSSDQQTIAELKKVLRDNHMNEHQALSAASFKAWSESLLSKSEDVVNANDSDGSQLLTVRTQSNDSTTTNGIRAASFSVRASDYHPVSLSLTTTTLNGQVVFELIEEQFEVVSLKDVDPEVFSGATRIEVASASTAPQQVREGEIDSNSNVAPLVANTNVSVATATTAEEVEVLDLLNRVGADITEQLTVTRAADGRLLVEGLVDTDKRKSEILTALSPVAKNPAVRIRVQTIDEARLALQKQKAQGTPGNVELIEVEKGSIPADSELRRYLSSKGGDTDAEIARFASRVISKSQSALFQASALNRMVGRFSSTQVNELEPDARAKWLRILRNYTAAVKRDTASLRADLQPIFGGFDGAGDETISSDADLIASARRLYAAAAANDRAVRSAFMLSSSRGSASAVSSGEFKRSVALVEQLASAIERFK